MPVPVGYLGVAARAACRPRAGAVAGAPAGLLSGVLWSVEVWAGGPAMLDCATQKAIGGTFALLAVRITIATGVALRLRRRDRRAA